VQSKKQKEKFQFELMLNKVINMKIEKKYCSDLNSILCKYLKQEQIHEYIESIAIDFLPQQPLRMTSDENQLNDYFNENIQTKKIRLLSDTLVTYIGKIMAEEKYITQKQKDEWHKQRHEHLLKLEDKKNERAR